MLKTTGHGSSMDSAQGKLAQTGIRIVYLNPSANLGGAESVLLDMLAGVRSAQPDWEIYLILGESGPVAGRAAALGVTVTVVPFPNAIARLGDSGAGGPAGQHIAKVALVLNLATALPATLSYSRRLRSVIKDIQPSLIHSNGFKMHLLALWSRPPGIPVVWHVHDFASKRPVMARLMRLHAMLCSKALTNSESVSADLRRVCPGLKVSTVLNAIDLSKFTPEGPSTDLDALAGLPQASPGTIKVGLLATMARWKGHEVFLRALNRIPPHIPLRGYIIGGPLYQTEGSQWRVEDLHKLAEELNVADRVGFTGFVSQPAAAMRALDIVVHASTDPEPFGLVIVEAMACARAVIVSQGGGTAEIVHDGADALAHSPGDIDELAQRIEQLALDGAMRSRLGVAGRVTALRLFSRPRLVNDILTAYRDLLTAKNGPHSSRCAVSETV